MILWAKQHAWLSCPKKGRWDAEALPPLDDPFLANCLLDAGPIESNGMGASAISPQRLESWCRLTGYDLTAWQAETVLAMSQGYATVFGDEKAHPPWHGDEVALSASKRIQAAIRGAR